jgi:hypothetical protein
MIITVDLLGCSKYLPTSCKRTITCIEGLAMACKEDGGCNCSAALRQFSVQAISLDLCDCTLSSPAYWCLLISFKDVNYFVSVSVHTSAACWIKNKKGSPNIVPALMAHARYLQSWGTVSVTCHVKSVQLICIWSGQYWPVRDSHCWAVCEHAVRVSSYW